MGRKDRALTGYLNRPAVFEELFNVGIYGGERVIAAENFAEMQNTYQETLKNRYGKKRKPVRARDVVKGLRINGHFVILAVECQAEINYCMPLRCMEYDMEEFARQLRHMRRRYEREGGLEPGAEFLSGIRKTDRLIPIISVVLFHGYGKWEAAARLQDMVDMEGLDERMRELHPDYRLHVIDLTELDENLFETGLRELVGMMKCSGEKEKMLQFMKENEERFRNMEDELYDLICVMVGLKKLEGRKEEFKNEQRGTYDMCIAFEEMLKDSREEGKRIGEREGEKRGERKGEKRGEARLCALISRLNQEGRNSEIIRAAQSVRIRNRLYREYGI